MGTVGFIMTLGFKHKHKKFVLEEIKIYQEVQMFRWKSTDQKKTGIKK